MIYLYLFGTCFHFIYVFMIIGNINKFRDNTVETDQIIGVYDLFESPHYLYLRLYKGDALLPYGCLPVFR